MFSNVMAHRPHSRRCPATLTAQGGTFAKVEVKELEVGGDASSCPTVNHGNAAARNKALIMGWVSSCVAVGLNFCETFKAGGATVQIPESEPCPKQSDNHLNRRGR